MMNGGWFYGLLLVGKMAEQSVGRSCRRKSFRDHVALCVYIYIYIYKAIPLQAWRGPEGSRRLRPPDFKTIGT